MPAEDGLATPEEAAELAKELSDAYLACRTYGHIWQPLTAVHNRSLHYWRATRRCPRCTTEKVEEISERGHVLASWYVYADGYLTEGIGRLFGDARGVLRLAAITRTFEREKQTPKQARADIPRSSKTRREVGLG